jgi:hypothetical protein
MGQSCEVLVLTCSTVGSHEREVTGSNLGEVLATVLEHDHSYPGMRIKQHYIIDHDAIQGWRCMVE